MNRQQLHQVQQHIFVMLQAQESALSAIRVSPISLVEKWQKFLEIILPIQLNALESLGFGSNQADLSTFNSLLLKHSREDQSLKVLNEKKWEYLFKTTFGLTEFKSLSLEAARALTYDIASAMADEKFLKEVDQVVSNLSSDATLLERRQAVLIVLLPLHMSVMARHGFQGEEGYVQAQQALMDYYYDPQIMQRAQDAQKLLFVRAKLIPS